MGRKKVLDNLELMAEIDKIKERLAKLEKSARACLERD